MGILQMRRRWLAAAVLFLAVPAFAGAPDQPELTKEQIKQFLLTAKVINAKQSKKGTTSPSKLTLSDGTITHDASFQPVDEHKFEVQMANMSIEHNFVDSYKYNIAAYRVAELLGMDDMLPVYVERKWKGQPGSLSWWLPVKMDEGERVKQHIEVPDPDAWNNQMYKVRVFDQLIDDTDANLTNVLIGEDFRIWRVDFTRAFRLPKTIRHPEDLVRCDRNLFAKLKSLDKEQVTVSTKGFLTKSEVEAMMARRDKIVAYFEKLIAQKGEAEVLY
jgi:hypothetical protein